MSICLHPSQCFFDCLYSSHAGLKVSMHACLTDGECSFLRYNSVRMLLPDVVEAMATALAVPASQMLIVCTWERQADAPAPMFAVPCHDQQAILELYNIIQNIPTSRLRVSGRLGMSKTSCTPFILAESSKALSVYPGWAQQHALKLNSTVFQPWPASKAQRTALEEHSVKMRQAKHSSKSPVSGKHAQDVSILINVPSQHLILADKACFTCGLMAKSAAEVADLLPANCKLLCAACKHARFCSKACQAANWGLHKSFCQSYKDMQK